MKKSIALVLAMLMTLSLTACGGGSDKGGALPGIDMKSTDTQTVTSDRATLEVLNETFFTYLGGLNYFTESDAQSKLTYTDVKYTAAVTTNGAGDYDGKLIISGPAGRVSEFVSEGFYVREVNDGLPKWTYSDAVWYVSPEGEIFPARMETTDNGDFYDAINNADAVGKMTFENIYTRSGSSHTTPDEKPTSSPKTFDAGMALYGVSALLSLTGTALVIKRKNG